MGEEDKLLGSLDAAFGVFDDDEDDQAMNEEVHALPPQVPMAKKSKVAKDSASASSRKDLLKEQPRLSDETSTSVEKAYSLPATSLLGTPSSASAPASQGTLNAMQTQQQEKPAAEEKIVVKHQVRHQVAIPPDYPYVPLSSHKPPETPAKTYPFTLDPFQEAAIHCIQRNESVLVSAHTSAGKTVVAEYAIAQGLKDKQRVIYTSPIKALSNQKYRELQEEFGDVGLMTGDVTINPSASVLVMTTEILRSMLYRGSEVMREVAWVVFDEIHYMRDKVRGVVWEETLILLPDKVHHVFLSATIPNAMQFAEWICRIHSQPCHVVYTDYRPTPLQHYLFPTGAQGIHLVVDEKSNFKEDNFQRAMASLTEDNKSGSNKRKRDKKVTEAEATSSDLYKIIRMIMVKNYHPVIVFSFGKRTCEGNALLLSKMDFNDQMEKDLVGSVFKNAIQSLSEEDRTLPQIEHILPLLRRGIGIHHSGLLPILKEVIEILFQEGLIKVLFATETFSIGLNMPARTVVFTDITKFDGKITRFLTGGEYIQMSGRAGRRGLDDRGIVILMANAKVEPDVAKSMLKGESDALHSAFHLTYTMILNLLRVEGIPPEQMLERSFFQFQNGAKIPQLEKELTVYQDRYDNLEIPEEETVSEYYSIRSQLDTYKKDIRDVLNHPTYCLQFLQPGRLARVSMPGKESSSPDLDFGWGVIVNFHKTRSKTGTSATDLTSITQEPGYVVDILLHCAPGTENGSNAPQPCAFTEKGDFVVIPCLLSVLDGLSSVRLYTPKDIKSTESRQQLWKTLSEVHKRFPDGVPLLDPIEDMKVTDEGFRKLVKKIQLLEAKLFENPLHNAPDAAERYELFDTKVKLGLKLKGLKQSITSAESILQLDELKARRRVLRRLGYTSDADVIQMKGRVACEISAGDELLLTEMIFNGVFNDLSIEQTVSLLSCFVCTEGKTEAEEVREECKGPLRVLQESAKRIVKVCRESKLPMDEEEYLNGFSYAMMGVCYAWCQGASFSQVCKMTSIFEGSLIRSVRRLEELLRQLVSAAKAIGNAALENKFAECITKIKRDIVFAASLYL